MRVLAPAPDCSPGHLVVGAGSRTEEPHTLTTWSQSSDTCRRHAEIQHPAVMPPMLTEPPVLLPPVPGHLECCNRILARLPQIRGLWPILDQGGTTNHNLWLCGHLVSSC